MLKSQNSCQPVSSSGTCGTAHIMSLKTAASMGRLPWFDRHGQPFEPYIIGISGGSGSGKSSVSNMIIRKMKVPWAIVLSLDSFYRSLSKVSFPFHMLIYLSLILPSNYLFYLSFSLTFFSFLFSI